MLNGSERAKERNELNAQQHVQSQPNNVLYPECGFNVIRCDRIWRRFQCAVKDSVAFATAKPALRGKFRRRRNNGDK